MIKATLKMKWNKEANLSDEDKKELKIAAMGVLFPPMAMDMLWKENVRLKKILKKSR